MASMRFENNEFLASKPGGQVLYFDNSPKLILKSRFGSYHHFDLRNDRHFRSDETRSDVIGVMADGKENKLGELFYHPPEWPGGPCDRRPTSTGEALPAETAVPVF